METVIPPHATCARSLAPRLPASRGAEARRPVPSTSPDRARGQIIGSVLESCSLRSKARTIVRSSGSHTPKADNRHGFFFSADGRLSLTRSSQDLDCLRALSPNTIVLSDEKKSDPRRITAKPTPARVFTCQSLRRKAERDWRLCFADSSLIAAPSNWCIKADRYDRW